MQDCIFIHALHIETLIGILPHERLARQTLCLDLDMQCCIRAAAASDAIDDALDYAAVVDCVIDFAARAEYLLLERFAEALTLLIFQRFPRCEALTLTLSKPCALPQTPHVGLRLQRQRSAYLQALEESNHE